MSRSLTIGGAGLRPAARSLPSLLFFPGIAYLLPQLAAKTFSINHMPKILNVFLNLPWHLRTISSLVLLLVGNSLIGRQLRHRDRKRFGPDVVEVPKFKTRWPWNIGFIPFILDSMENGYSIEGWVGFLEDYENTVNLKLLGGDLVITSEPESVKCLLSTDFASYEKGPAFRDKMYSVLGNGLFNSDGALWKSHRNMTRPYFSKDRISHFDIFARNSDKAISKILARFEEPARNDQPLAMDFQSLAQYFTLDSSAEFLFGDSVHSLDSPLAHPHSPQPNHPSAAFANAFQHVLEKLMERFSLDMLWPWFELWRDRTGDDMQVISSYIKPIMDKKLDEYRSSNNKVLDEENHTFLDDLLQRTTDEKLIKDQILNILIAGRDSTGGTLTFAVYFLAMDPAVLAKLRGEIISHVGPNAYPTAEHFKEMKYLRSVIDETLRLFPPLPINERTSVRSTVLKSSGGKSFYIAAGTNVNFSVMHMHRRKDLWGPDAEDFDPERWFGERLEKYVGLNPSIFLPFNTGPRNCLGQQFAYNIMSFFLVRLLQRIETIELVPEAQPIGTLPPPPWKGAAGRKGFEQIWPKCYLMSSCHGGLWVRMTPAKLMEK